MSKKTQLMWHRNLCIACGQCVVSCPNGYPSQNQFIECDDLDSCTKCVDSCAQLALVKKGQLYKAQDLANELEEDSVFFNETSGGVTVSGGEPLSQGQGLVTLVKELKSKGINVWLDTCGVDEYNVLHQVLPFLEGVLFDMKHADEKKLKYWTNGSLDLVLKSLEIVIKAKVNIIIRWPLIGGVNDDLKSVRQMIELFNHYKIKTVNLIPYHELGLEKWSNLNWKVDSATFYKVKEDKVKMILEMCTINNIECLVEE
jgi:pyruvate formate lyase activating enzyme